MTKNDERKGHCELNVLADLLRNDPVACAMCIISNCEAEFNLLGEWKCRGDKSPICPVCQSIMKCRDTRKRQIRQEGGIKLQGTIRRLYCEKCHRLHNELPINLSPHKHYEVETIEGVVDELISPDDLESEDYPCERTMERWKLWIEHNRLFIEGYVRSIGYRLLDLGIEFLKTEESILDYLRDKFRDRENHWLTMINRMVYNTGASLEPWPSYAP